MFELHTPFAPCGDQPQAIDALVKGVREEKKAQVLLGITGSGKTFTMANVIKELQRPALIIAHNKTLAAQLYQEFKSFFPNNAVEYFVSYYDYYQPEAYIPRTDTYIEKDFAINDKIDKMRLSATKSLLERRDVVIVASVSCIYGLGSPKFYQEMILQLRKGDSRKRDDILIHLIHMQYERTEMDLTRATFRSRGDTLDIFPAYEEDIAVRIEFFGNEIERISWFDPLTGARKQVVDEVSIYPGSHYVTPEEVRASAMVSIKQELQERLAYLESQNKIAEMQRLQQRTLYDLEMIREIGFCNGIENYSRHFGGRLPGDPPECLIDYFPDDWLLFIDESHQTIPQLHAMYNGDRARKHALVEYGFRLPSAYDNRPLKFDETYSHINQVIYVSATPSEFEVSEAKNVVVEQVIRPTGLLDPKIEVRSATNQVDDALSEIHKETKQGRRVLVTTLTKRLSEELTKYLCDIGVKAKYLHSEIDVLERFTIIHDLRKGVFDVLVGINLLREGLDIPEVSLVVILDADKEGFLRSETSLIQICGRAARNVQGRVIMYADKLTGAITHTIAITEHRRAVQEEYNKKHNITPQSTKRELTLLDVIEETEEKEQQQYRAQRHEKPSKEMIFLSQEEITKHIQFWKNTMNKAAKELRFDDAAHARDRMREYEEMELTLMGE